MKRYRDGVEIAVSKVFTVRRISSAHILAQEQLFARAPNERHRSDAAGCNFSNHVREDFHNPLLARSLNAMAVQSSKKVLMVEIAGKARVERLVLDLSSSGSR